MRASDATVFAPKSRVICNVVVGPEGALEPQPASTIASKTLTMVSGGSGLRFSAMD